MANIYYESITGNPPPELNYDEREKEFYRGKSVLITGAGGSIGSRIALRLSRLGVTNLALLDRDENALHTLSLELENAALFDTSRFFLADIRDYERTLETLHSVEPQIVIHCAALKHLAILEQVPREATLTNVFGTLNILKASIDVGVEYFLNISTDKAANPTSVLGMSKRITELLTIDARRKGNHKFANVRFGNVFNSKGSVIETFRFQLSRNLPVTLTHKEMTRYFMHVDEAASLAIKSVFLGTNPIYLFDMGEPIFLIDVINRMKGILNSKSDILFTGIRSGEKLREDLIGKREKLIPTHYPKIMAIDTEVRGVDLFHLPQMSSIKDDNQAIFFLQKHLLD